MLPRRDGPLRADFLHVFAAEEIAARLGLVSREFQHGLLCGRLSPQIRAALDGCAARITTVSPFAGDDADVLAGTALPFSRQFDLAVALGGLHTANDPVARLGEIRGTLQPDGLFLGVAAAAGTLWELRDALFEAETELTGGAGMRVAPFSDVRRWGDALARAGFALPVSDEMGLTVRYSALSALLDDLGGMGERGVLRQRTAAPKELFRVAEEVYRTRFSDPDGRLRASFSFAFLSGWAPHKTQQKAVKRGSASMRLEDALNAVDGGARKEPDGD
ncbi:MAG: SAM-dependent methyltransferase [Pseudomonadota bacterium]